MATTATGERLSEVVPSAAVAAQAVVSCTCYPWEGIHAVTCPRSPAQVADWQARRAAHRERQQLSLQAKVKNQRKMIRHLQKSLALYQSMWGESNARFRLREIETSAAQRRPVDYRSCCMCWTCRLRREYQFRTGLTYPGTPGWRLPFSSRWPRWQ